ncbi:LysR family transcriptional regulator [Psychromonas sp. 14N.309.X.WAT.B.A12]|uniref:LysR family transcriptional regulator n=1 Tax=unclassified Psychromonas TaxID=2614957 RepID=UPI0025B1E60A|nr:LysR family transcriptional regulator [Psychromonas sp. 14N.309.X.WAT.B.A12]MDN2663224.1 LysR family transcriptional regulator [Psychromonas sp. 14N.309.X.WAT.B.A12]
MKKSSIIPKPIAEYDLRLLRIFVSVVENGGFSAAESALGITRSTISIHMSNLEERMKLKLCLRGRGGFALTEDGHTVYRAVINLFDSLNDFSLLVGSLSNELSGELVILCADQLNQTTQNKLSQVIKIIHQDSPNLHLVLDSEPIANIEKSLLKDKAHIGLFPGYQQIEGLTYQHITDEAVYLCCSKDHPFFNKVDTVISAADLAEVPAIHPGVDIEPSGSEQLKKLNLMAKSYQFDTRKAMIMSGSYIGFMPQSYIQEELNQGEMRIIRPSEITYPFNLSLVAKKTPREANKVALLTEVFNRVFNEV